MIILYDRYSGLAFDATTKAKKAAAYLALFKEFDGKYTQFYEPSEMEGKELVLYNKAKDGDSDAARGLLVHRKNNHYEYEDEWDFIEVTNPLAE